MKRRDVPVTASSLDDEISLKGVLMKRKDFFGLDENALSHPNRTYYLRREEEGTIDAYSKAIQHDPTNTKSYFLRGNLYFRKNKFVNALSDFTFVLNTDSDNVDCLCNRGVTYSKLGMHQEAIRDLSAALTLRPLHFQAAFERAASYSSLGQYSKAIADYTFALSQEEAVFNQESGREKYNLKYTGSGSIPHTPLCISPTETPTSTSPIPYTTSLSTSFTTSLNSPFSSSSPISLNTKTKSETDCEDERDENEHLYDRFDKSHSSDKDFLNCDSKIGKTIRSDKIENTDNNINYSNYNDGDGGNSDSDTIDNDNDNGNSDIDSIIRMTENVRLCVENTYATIANNGKDDVNAYISTGKINGKSEKNKKKKGQENKVISSEQLVLYTAHHSSVSVSNLTDVPILPTPLSLSFPDGTHNTTLFSSQNRLPITLPSTAQNTTTISTSSSSSSSTSTTSPMSTPTSSRANKHYLDGCVWGKKGEYERAILEYSLALKIRPNLFEALFNRAFALDKIGLIQRAVTDYTSALGLRPDNAFAFYNRGISYDRLGNLESAVQDLSRAIDLMPSCPDFYHNRAFAYEKLGLSAQALTDYSSSLSIRPLHLKTLHSRAACLEATKDYEGALRDYSALLDIQPDHINSLISRAAILDKINDPMQSLRDVTRALSIVKMRQRSSPISVSFSSSFPLLSDSQSQGHARGYAHSNAYDFAVIKCKGIVIDGDDRNVSTADESEQDDEDETSAKCQDEGGDRNIDTVLHDNIAQIKQREKKKKKRDDIRTVQRVDDKENNEGKKYEGQGEREIQGEGERGEEEKREGNNYGRDSAVDSDTIFSLLSFRASLYSKLNLPENAIADLTEAIDYAQNHRNGRESVERQLRNFIFSRAASYQSMGWYLDAISDYSHLLDLMDEEECRSGCNSSSGGGDASNDGKNDDGNNVDSYDRGNNGGDKNNGLSSKSSRLSSSSNTTNSSSSSNNSKNAPTLPLPTSKIPLQQQQHTHSFLVLRSSTFAHRGYCLRKLGNFRDSLSDYSAAISLSPMNVQAYSNRAYVLSKLGMLSEAAADYSEVILLDPDNSNAHRNRSIAMDRLRGSP